MSSLTCSKQGDLWGQTRLLRALFSPYVLCQQCLANLGTSASFSELAFFFLVSVPLSWLQVSEKYLRRHV